MNQIDCVDWKQIVVAHWDWIDSMMTTSKVIVLMNWSLMKLGEGHGDLKINWANVVRPLHPLRLIMRLSVVVVQSTTMAH